MNQYYSGQGRVYLAKYENGVKGVSRWLGNVPSLSIETDVESIEHQESYTGQRTTDKKITTKKTVKVNFTLEDISNENLALAFFGDIKKVVGASVSDEMSPILTKNGSFLLKHNGVSNVVIKDKDNQPLIKDTDFVVDEKFGRVTYISDSQTLKMPLKVSYDHKDNTHIKFLSSAQGEYELVFDGLNTAESNAPLQVIVHKIALDPAGTFDLINDEFNQFEITGEALMTDEGIVSIRQ